MTGVAKAYARAALASECDRVASLIPTTQAAGLCAAALRIGGLVKANALPEAEARAALLAAARRMADQHGREPWTDKTRLVQINRGLRHAEERAIPEPKERPGSPPPPARDIDAERRRREETERAAAEAERRREAEERQNIGNALRIWKEAFPVLDPRAGPLRIYLASRGIRRSAIAQHFEDAEGFFDALRFHPETPRGRTERLPAMIALARDVVTGEPRAIQRTFLTPDGRGKIQHGERKLSLGPVRGAAVMLMRERDDVTHGLGIAEGVETALSAVALGWAPCWATLGAPGMASFPVLPGVEALTIFADNCPTGERAAMECAGRWRVPPSPAVVRIMAPTTGDDWNDTLRARAAA